MTKIGEKFNKKSTYRNFLHLKERCSLSWLKETPPEGSSNKVFLCFCPIFWDHFDLLGSGSRSTDPIESWSILDPDLKHYLLQTSCNLPCNFVALKFFLVCSHLSKNVLYQMLNNSPTFKGVHKP
jgi:hypothetical protein